MDRAPLRLFEQGLERSWNGGGTLLGGSVEGRNAAAPVHVPLPPNLNYASITPAHHAVGAYQHVKSPS